jgi:ssDNA thymidine ADP-ribosyltransferase, DarT
MDSTKTTYSTFPFEWTVKSTSYKIQYRKAFNINEVDEIFCSIINANGNKIIFSELGIMLGFNLQDLAEIDIFKIYLKGLTEYNLIEINEKEQIIQLTEFGQEAIQSKLKYKYYFATTELFENQTATGECYDFSFKYVFDIENRLTHEREFKEITFENLALKQKLQYQLFGNDIYKGEIVVLYESEPRISYKTIFLQTEITAFDNSLELSIFKSGANKSEVQFLIGLPENAEFKSKLLRQGMYHHILLVKTSITRQDIETYIDLWNWKELAASPKLDWNDNTIFELFRKNGDGGIWSIISEKAPIQSIKSVIEKYADYWNWTTLTERFDDEFIKEQIETYDWDFEELSYKATGLVTSLLSNLNLKEKGWDWNYLSKNLPNEFIEKHIDNFSWDFYLITELKGDILRNLFKNQGKSNYTKILLSKPWNWKFISKEFKDNFLYEQIHFIASKVDWHIVLERFFTSEEITSKCLKDESFKSLLNLHLSENFVITHQRYLWTPELIDFFENQNLIQWETQKYINGFDTNENVEWSKPVFQKYQNHITTENGFLNVSKQISDYTLISDFPDFAWNWEGISKNKKLISNATFIEKAFTGELSFSNNLLWNEILSQSTIDVSFWNKNLEAFYKATESEKQIQFWKILTQKERIGFVFENKHFPWDWTSIAENSSIETILDSYEDDELFEKWDWKIATRKIDKETILENLDILTKFIDWEYTINEIFNNEFVFDNSNLKIAYRLSQLESERQIEIWKILTAKYPFEKIFPLIEKTFDFDVWKWDWEYISSHPHLPNDFKTLNQIKHKIIWVKFSDNESIKRKFEYNKSEWSYNEYFKYILKYLKVFQNFWDWKVLTQNSNLHYNREFIKIFQDKWDWKYLSGNGGFILQKKRDNENYLLALLLEFQQIHFPILSQRKDIELNSDLILETRNRDWDWQVLSENEKAEISNELILELKNKNWNWQALSKRKNIEFSNETLLQLLDKDWDWNYLSENTNLEFNADFIEKTKSKSWNWKLVSRHKSFSLSVEILTLTKDYDLDWQYISKHSSLSPTKEILAKFENKWNWQSITENPQINFDDIDFLERFADKWNWNFICESGKLSLNNQILTKFKEHLNWNLISSNTNVHFSKEIIQEFKQFWNWSNLKANKRVEELLGSYVTDEINKNATLNFIDKIEQQWSEWKGSIYHFSHIDNAVEIIKNRKIQSRNKANIKGDAAGNVVHRRGDAHNYARFYFRPQTPTQFYNEFLGKNTTDGYETHGNWISWYDKARGLGFPKCPIPIFFRFSTKEVLFKYEKKCCVSNGNMQADFTQFNSIEKMLDKFNFDYLYSNMSYDKEHNRKYINFSQQEFLVQDELSFYDLLDFEIVCPSQADRTLLINLLGNEHKDIFSKIVVDISYYNNENPRVRIEEEDSELHISTNFNGEGYFVLNGASDIKEMDILVGDVTKTSKDKIIFKSNISLGNVKQNIQLNFIDESNRSWFVYAK